MEVVNPAYIKELKTIVKKSPYLKHMAMALDHIEIDGAKILYIKKKRLN